jgi:predicted exporter
MGDVRDLRRAHARVDRDPVARPPWDDDPARLNPLPPSLAAQDRALRESAGAPDARFFALVRAPALEDALARTETLAKPLAGLVERRQLGGYTLVTDDVPSDATQRSRLAMLPDADELRARVQRAQQGVAVPDRRRSRRS